MVNFAAAFTAVTGTLGIAMSNQPWFSIAGLIADIGGFLVLAYEWREAIRQAEEDDVDNALNVGAWGIVTTRGRSVSPEYKPNSQPATLRANAGF